MKKHKFNGHIININSLAGHYVPSSPKFNVYSASKNAVTIFTRALLNELAHSNSYIKVTSLSPGLVRTNMVDAQDKDIQMLEPKDIADAVCYVLATPPNVNRNGYKIKTVIKTVFYYEAHYPLNWKTLDEAKPNMLVVNCTSARRISNFSVQKGDGAFASDESSL
ncbi:unnamed protein product [Leptosia nina]|uniref:Uncharacterized protein n=1 Tax=Leptosia nina TaxID=320188 RepID=A0AAV1IWK9_9NEOP